MLKLALPSKGRLMEKSFAWFAERGIMISRAGAEREYRAEISGIEGIEPVFLSAGEIPRELAAGRVHYGVTGSDLVREKLPNWSALVSEEAKLGFGHARLIIAVPDLWVDVNTLDDLDGAAAQFRRTHGFRMRIATKYHRLVREFLTDAGVADYQLVDSQGATEGVVRNETAEAIADITSTGETLRANGLKILDDALVHDSQATLFRSARAPWAAEDQAIALAFSQRLSSL